MFFRRKNHADKKLYLALALFFCLLLFGASVSRGQECCWLGEFIQANNSTNSGDAVSLATLTVVVNPNCNVSDLTVALTSYSVNPTPLSGSFTLSMVPSSPTLENGDFWEGTSTLVVTPTTAVPTGTYTINVTVEITCVSATASESHEYTGGPFPLQVTQAEPTGECCSFGLSNQLTFEASLGETFPLATLTMNNRCLDTEPLGAVQVQNLLVEPDPRPGEISVFPLNSFLSIPPGDSDETNLIASISPEVPPGLYRITVDLTGLCTGIFEDQQQALALTRTYLVDVGGTEAELPPSQLRIPGSLMRSVCAAPGSTILIPVRGISDPAEFKWQGEVQFGNGRQPMDLLAASESAVVTVVPPGTEGKTKLWISGPSGRSNSVFVNVDPSCSSNQGEPITEERLRKLAQTVPEEYRKRATNQSGELLSFLPGEIVVQTDADPTQLETLKEKYGVASFEQLVGTNLYVARLENRSVVHTLQTADKLAGDPLVQYARENGLMTEVQAESVPNDPQLREQEQLEAINLFTGWRSFFPIQGRGITLAVIDTGVDLELRDEIRTSPVAPNGVNVASGHEDLAALIGTSTAEDRRGHGTIVSGLAAARGDNEQFGAGVAYNSLVLPIKVFGRSRFTPKDVIAKGLVAAYFLEADVVNMSLGCARCRPSKERQSREYFGKVIDQLNSNLAQERLVPPIVVAATGNDGEGIVDSPAADPRVIAIGSWNNRQKKVSDFSNYGSEVDFVAPGENVFTALQGGQFGDAGSGTSFASPQVAGLVALILSTEPKLKEFGPDAVRQKIRECFAVDVLEPGKDDKSGWGLIRIPAPDDVDPSKCLTFEKEK